MKADRIQLVGIIGAGLSELASAVLLARKGLRVKVLEAHAGAGRCCLSTYLPLPIFLLAAGGITGGLPDSHRFAVQAESRMRIEGSSTVNTFTCLARDLTGYLIHDGPAAAATSHMAGPHLPQAVLVVPVRSFSCGDRRMDRDLYRALKASDFPEIRYELSDVEILDNPSESSQTHRLHAAGRLTVAGTTRPIKTALPGLRLPDGRLRATGVQEMRMSDFGIERPSALWGLIKARDRLLIRFDLIAAPEDTENDG